MIKLVAFDLDGTIADTIPMCIEAFKQAVSPYASKILSEDDIVKTFGLNEEGMIKEVVSTICGDKRIDNRVEGELNYCIFNNR